MTKRLEILKASLVKKEQKSDEKFKNYFSCVAESNGQPLNDKRNGQSTLKRWSRLDEGIRTSLAEIEKTKRAIEKEQLKIEKVEEVTQLIPKEILDLVNNGTLKQWRRHPNTFFVSDVEKARIVWLAEKKSIAHRYFSEISSKEQKSKFARIFNELNANLLILNKG